jgi:hypothetical protein
MRQKVKNASQKRAVGDMARQASLDPIKCLAALASDSRLQEGATRSGCSNAKV